MDDREKQIFDATQGEYTMNIEHIEIAHNKKITAVFSLLLLLTMAGLGACIALIGVNFADISESIGLGLTIAVAVLLSLCIVVLLMLFTNQVTKFRRKIIFVADENGICDYSRHIVLPPVAYSEI